MTCEFLKDATQRYINKFSLLAFLNLYAHTVAVMNQRNTCTKYILPRVSSSI